MGKWCGNIGCGEYDSKEKCGCHLHGAYAYDCIDFIEGDEPQNLPEANVKPTLSEVLAEVEKRAFWDYVPGGAIRIEDLKDELSEYFA